MNVNFIDFSELCDRAFAAMLNNERTYVKTESGIYVPPPGNDAKQRFSYGLGLFIKEKFSQYDKNFIVRSCKPCYNWRLKHIGKKFLNVVDSRRIIPYVQPGNKIIEIGSGWEDYFNDFFEKTNFKKFEVPEVDAIDITSVISISETIVSIPYKSNICLYDANEVIDHSSQIPKYVMNTVSRCFIENGALK